MDLTVTKPMKLMRGATTSLIYLFGQQRPRIAQRRQWLSGRAITWSIGATSISPTGRYPTSTLTTCKVSSSCLNNKQRVINKATSQSRGRRLQ